MYRGWLREALWSYGDLPAIGDCDADNRYVAEVGKLRSELQGLMMAEAVAWKRLVYEHHYAVNLDPAHPQPDVMDGGECFMALKVDHLFDVIASTRVNTPACSKHKTVHSRRFTHDGHPPFSRICFFSAGFVHARNAARLSVWRTNV